MRTLPVAPLGCYIAKSAIDHAYDQEVLCMVNESFSFDYYWNTPACFTILFPGDLEEASPFFIFHFYFL